MNEFLKRAQELNAQTLTDRRHLHQNAEAGEDLPNTTAYVMKRLEEIGLEPTEICQSGICALIEGGAARTDTQPRKTIMLRADMDALPMGEINDLPFRTQTNAAHCCGHDMHTAMLLCAAQILNERKADLAGNVKLMFQPAEEVFKGSQKMIAAGILENPHVDAAMGIHVMFDAKVPYISYGSGFMTSSCDGFKITVHGTGSHGATPHLGIDPINVGTHIYSAFQNLIARECPSKEQVSLTFGAFQAGDTSNIIPQEAVLMGTLRTYNQELREKLVRRMHEICTSISTAFGASADYEVLADVPATYSDPELTAQLVQYAEEIEPDIIFDRSYRVTPSDDFAFVAREVPTTYFMLNCKVDGCNVAHHNPYVLFDEAALPYGAALHATCAYRYLTKS